MPRSALDRTQSLALALVVLAIPAFAVSGCRTETAGIPGNEEDALAQHTEASTHRHSSFRLPHDAGPLRQLKTGGVHRYRMELRTNTFVRLKIEQKGIDVETEVKTPDLERLFVVDGPTGAAGTEEVTFIADRHGEFEISVRSLRSETPNGAYAIQLAALRPAFPKDRTRAEAVKAFHQAKAALNEASNNDLARAIKQLRFSAGSWNELDEKGREADARYLLGLACSREERVEQAVQAIEEAVRLFGRVGDSSSEAAGLNDLGNLLVRQERLDLARTKFELALALHESGRTNAPKRGSASVKNNLGVLLERQGYYWSASELLLEALAYWREAGRRLEAVKTLISLATAYTSLAELRLAHDAIQEARMLVEPETDLELWAQIESRQGHLALETSDPKTALNHYEKSLEAREILADVRGQAVALTGIGQAYYQLSEPRQALEAYQQALTLLADQSHSIEQAVLFNNLAWLYSELGAPTRALDFYLEGLSLAKRAKALQVQAPILLGMARAERMRGRRVVARQHIDEAINILENSRNEAAERNVPSDLHSTFISAPDDYYDFLVTLLMEDEEKYPGKGFSILALGASEQGRARGLTSELGTKTTLLERQGHEVRDDSLRQESRDINNLPKTDYSRPNREATPTLSLSEAFQERTERFRTQRTRTEPTGRKHSSLTNPWISIVEEIQEQLDGETLLLRFHIGHDKSFLWSVTTEEVEGYELGSPLLITRQAHEIHRLLRSSHGGLNSFATYRAAARLSSELLGPIASELQKYRRLLIVPSGSLESLPFASLPMPSANDTASTPRRLLVEQNEIVMLPSGTSLAALRTVSQGRERAPQRLAIIADPIYEGSDERLEPVGRLEDTSYQGPLLPRLRHSSKEAESIYRCSGEGTLFEGVAANRSLVRSGDLETFRTIHFATHGTANPNIPGLSTIELSRFDAEGQAIASAINAHEIASLSLSAEMVVLSSCESAVGPQLRGEGRLGLTRAFLLAGTSRVIVSLWRVGDQATSELMEIFYCNLYRLELTPGEALRQAQETLRHTPEREEPYYWAGFVMYGDPHAWPEIAIENIPPH